MKIDITNYEAFLLLYIDNELSATQKAAVDLFLQENPVYQKELSLLQQAVLKPEAIAYEDKALLYRFEEMEVILPNEFKQNLYRKEAPVVKGFFTNKRMRAVSAVAALFLLMFGYRYTIKVPEQSQLNTVAVRSSIAQSNANRSANLITPLAAILPAKNQHVNNFSTKDIQESKNEVANLNTEPLAIIVPENTTTSLASIEKIEHMDAVQNTSIPNITTNNIAAAEPTESFEELNTENPDRVIYVANLEIDGDKLRGFTRRVSALLRRNKTEKEK
jgi:hypothetical protein